MRAVTLDSADLSWANLSGAASNSGQSTKRVIGANLHGASARKANFKGAIMVRVRLNYADLTGAVFDGANMTRVQLQGAIYEVGTFDKALNV